MIRIRNPQNTIGTYLGFYITPPQPDQVAAEHVLDEAFSITFAPGDAITRTLSSADAYDSCLLCSCFMHELCSWLHFPVSPPVLQNFMFISRITLAGLSK